MGAIADEMVVIDEVLVPNLGVESRMVEEIVAIEEAAADEQMAAAEEALVQAVDNAQLGEVGEEMAVFDEVAVEEILVVEEVLPDRTAPEEMNRVNEVPPEEMPFVDEAPLEDMASRDETKESPVVDFPAAEMAVELQERGMAQVEDVLEGDEEGLADEVVVADKGVAEDMASVAETVELTAAEEALTKGLAMGPHTRRGAPL